MTDPTWVKGAAGSGFGSDHLPYGRFRDGSDMRVGVRIGDHVLDVSAASIGTPWKELFHEGSLVPLLQAGPATWQEVRAWLRHLVSESSAQKRVAALLRPVASTEMLIPVEVGDYVDFYASQNHAANVGTMFRPGAPGLLPNWRHLPVSYHGRAGTVIVSGTEVRRPLGQATSGPADTSPTFGPSRKLDIEAELGFVVGVPTPLGSRISVERSAAHLFGVVGLNDWSARDIQAWEYVPLGPHLAKSFATSISAWVTPLAALASARVPLPEQNPRPLPHLWSPDLWGLDIQVSVRINGAVVSTPPYRGMYWSPEQMLAHLTSNGAAVRAGDLLGSGTISGAEPSERGSLLELSWNGTREWAPQRQGFLEDDDVVVLEYRAPSEYGHIALGEVCGRILPAAG